MYGKGCCGSMKIGKRTGKRWRRGGTSGKRPERGSKSWPPSWSFLLHNCVKGVVVSHQEPLCKTFRYGVMYITRVREAEKFNRGGKSATRCVMNFLHIFWMGLSAECL